MPSLFQQGQCDVIYTNTQTVATLKGRGVDIEFVKLETGAITFLTTLHIAKGAADVENAYKYIDIVASKEAQEALTKPPLQLHPGEQGRPAARLPADEEPRRDVDLHPPRSGEDQSAARRWIEKFNKEMAK